jgi:DNA replication ATP-dependent helicase Dna2
MEAYMPRLDKGTLALTFKFNCDRFLRFRLASDGEKDALGIESDTYKRPGIELIKAAGRRWEADKYQDLIDTSPPNTIEYVEKVELDELVGRRTFGKVKNLFDILQREHPPFAIIEAEYLVPSSITPGLQQAYDTYELELVRARPDIIWIRPYGTGAPMIGAPDPAPEYELHIIDVKMAAEPSLRHFTEVTYYALSLAAALAERGMAGRYGVSAEGFIWPGSHDANTFRNLVRDHQARGVSNPVTLALLETLVPVPYEVYQVHVKQFFEERLLRVLGQAPVDAAWHVGSKCQLCDYVRYCRQEAETCDHLSRLPWLNQGQAELIRQNGIATTDSLRNAIVGNTPQWQGAESSSHQLRADAPILSVRAEALATGQPVVIDGRRCALMPAWSDQNIFITIHFDPGSGITFAMGAARVYFQPGRNQGDPPKTEEHVFVVDRVDAMNPDTERARLVEFVTLVSAWLEEVSDTNNGLPAAQRVSSHIFFWDLLEVRQIRRMFERHMNHPEVVDLIELLIRLFPPNQVLPDPDIFKSQPGTVVKDVVRLILGLPVPHDYSLFDTGNTLFPVRNENGDPYEFRLPFGFSTPMSDQIPFERAYELWQDTIFLRHFDSRFPGDPSRWRRYTRDELYEGIKHATRTHLRALQHVVRRLREQYRDRLTLRKAPFSAAPPTQTRIPERARSLIAFEKLNVACQELENRQRRLLPVAEREAHFFSIRGLRPASGAEYDDYIDEIRTADARYAGSELLVFTFSPTSRDARINEGDFLLALSNEDDDVDLDVPWRKYLGLSFADAQALLFSEGLNDNWMVNAPLGRLLQVEAVRLEAMREPPHLVLRPSHNGLFSFAIDQGLFDLQSPLVLDPLYQDFSSARVAQALRTVGGNPPPMQRRRRRV